MTRNTYVPCVEMLNQNQLKHQLILRYEHCILVVLYACCITLPSFLSKNYYLNCFSDIEDPDPSDSITEDQPLAEDVLQRKEGRSYLR